MADVNVGAIVAELKLNSSKFGRGINKANSSLNKMNRGVKNLSRSLLAVAGVGGFGFLAKEAVGVMADFEQSLANVRAVTQATAGEMDKLSVAAQRLGSKTKFSAGQAAEGMEFLGRAGFNTQEILATIEDTLNLAAAGSIDLASAADISSNALSAFRLEAGQLNRVVDVMALTTAKSNTNVQQMGDALKFAAPAAAGFGVSVESTSAGIALLSNAGLQATLAGTGMRKVMVGLGAPTEDLAKKMGGLTLQSNGLVAVLKQIAKAGITTSEAFKFFGDRGAGAFNILVNATGQLEDFERMLLKTAKGSAAQQAEIKMNTLSGRFLELKSAIEAVLIAGGDTGFLGLLKDMTQALTEFIRGFADFDDAQSSLEMVEEKIREVKKLIESKKDNPLRGTIFDFGGIDEDLDRLGGELKGLQQIADNIRRKIRADKAALEKPGVPKDEIFGPPRPPVIPIRPAKFIPGRPNLRVSPLDRSLGGIPIAPLENETAKFRQQVRDFANRSKNLRDEFDRFEAAAFQEFNVLDIDGISGTDAARAVAKKLDDLFQLNVEPQMTESPESIAKSKEQMEALGIIAEATQDKMDNFRKASSFLHTEFLRGNMTQEDYNKNMAALRQHFNRLPPGVQAVTDAIDALNSQLEGSMTDIFQGLINGTLDFKEAMVDTLLAIQRELIRTLIVKQLLAGIGNLFSAGASSAAGAAGSAGDFSFFGGTGFAGGRAVGGPVAGGRAFTVGENGPEVFVPPQSGSILRGQDIGDASEIHLHVTTGIQNTIKAELAQMMPEIRESLLSAVAEKRLRGGQFSVAMGV